MHYRCFTLSLTTTSTSLPWHGMDENNWDLTLSLKELEFIHLCILQGFSILVLFT